MISSPFKGLERLSEELKHERQKTGVALQEKAKLQIEVEALRKRLENQNLESKESQSTIAKYEPEIQSLRQNNSELIELNSNLRFQLQTFSDQMINAQATIEEKDREIQKLDSDLQQSREDISKIRQTAVSYETRCNTKDQTINELQQTIDELRQVCSRYENRALEIEDRLEIQAKAFETQSVQLLRTREAREESTLLKSGNESLRQEYNDLLARFHVISSQHNELTFECKDLSRKNEIFEATILQMQEEREKICEELDSMEKAQVELQKKAEVEAENTRSSQARCEMAIRGRQFLETQITELTLAHSSSLARESELESQLSLLKIQLSTYENEMSQLKERASQVEDMTKQLEKMNHVNLEVEELRGQLNEMRKQQVKKEIEDNSSFHVDPQNLLNREQQTREVFESIISDLRTELDDMTRKFRDLKMKGESTSSHKRIDQLEAEIEMYKESVRVTSQETHNVALSAAEALSRSSRSSHDKHQALRQLKEVQSLLSQSNQQNDQLQEEIKEEKKRFKNLFHEKIAVERRVAELMTEKCQIEMKLDELNQHHHPLLLELEMYKRQVEQQKHHISELQSQLSELSGTQGELTHTKQLLQAQANQFKIQEMEYQSEIQGLLQGKAILQREMESLQFKLDLAKRDAETHLKEVEKHRRDCEELRTDRERYKRDFALQESQRAESQLHEFRLKLEATSEEFRESERDRTAMSQSMKTLQLEMNRERERASLLRTQLSLSEEQLKLAHQELSVFRSLDVYQQSMDGQLQSYRLKNQQQQEKQQQQQIQQPHQQQQKPQNQTLLSSYNRQKSQHNFPSSVTSPSSSFSSSSSSLSSSTTSTSKLSSSSSPSSSSSILGSSPIYSSSQNFNRDKERDIEVKFDRYKVKGNEKGNDEGRRMKIEDFEDSDLDNRWNENEIHQPSTSKMSGDWNEKNSDRELNSRDERGGRGNNSRREFQPQKVEEEEVDEDFSLNRHQRRSEMGWGRDGRDGERGEWEGKAEERARENESQRKENENNTRGSPLLHHEGIGKSRVGGGNGNNGVDNERGFGIEKGLSRKVGNSSLGIDEVPTYRTPILSQTSSTSSSLSSKLYVSHPTLITSQHKERREKSNDSEKEREKEKEKEKEGGTWRERVGINRRDHSSFSPPTSTSSSSFSTSPSSSPTSSSPSPTSFSTSPSSPSPSPTPPPSAIGRGRGSNVSLSVGTENGGGKREGGRDTISERSHSNPYLSLRQTSNPQTTTTHSSSSSSSSSSSFLTSPRPSLSSFSKPTSYSSSSISSNYPSSTPPSSHLPLSSFSSTSKNITSSSSNLSTSSTSLLSRPSKKDFERARKLLEADR